MAYKANRIEGVDNDSKSKKRYEKIELLSDEVLQKSKGDNFYLLSSVGVYDQNITVKMKKDMLQKYNMNSNGEYHLQEYDFNELMLNIVIFFDSFFFNYSVKSGYL